MLLSFCSEGDNTSEAIQLALYFDEWKALVPRKDERPAVKIPVSWKNLFGNAPPAALY